MVTNVHITRISERTAAHNAAYDTDVFSNNLHGLTDCPDRYDTQNNGSWTAKLTGQRTETHHSRSKMERKYPIRIFTIQHEV